jgi:hypothetical protein
MSGVEKFYYMTLLTSVSIFDIGTPWREGPDWMPRKVYTMLIVRGRRARGVGPPDITLLVEQGSWTEKLRPRLVEINLSASGDGNEFSRVGGHSLPS